MNKNSNLNRHATVQNCIIVIIILTACLLLLFESSNILLGDDNGQSSDIGLLFDKHYYECVKKEYYPYYNNAFEPLISLINFAQPICISNINIYSGILSFTILILIAITFLLLNTHQKVLFLLFQLIYYDAFTQIHLFRQIAATHLIVIAFLLNFKKNRHSPRLALLLAASLHNATFLIFGPLIFSKNISVFVKCNKFMLTIFAIALFIMVAIFSDELLFYMVGRYEFALRAADSTALIDPLLKYFIFALLIGLVTYSICRDYALLAQASMLVLAFILLRNQNLSGEFLFRIFIGIKIVILPAIMAISLGNAMSSRLSRW